MSNDTEQQQASKESAYPVFDLATCLEFAQAIRDLGGSTSPVKKSTLARQVGLAESTPSFFQKLSSAKTYGIIDGWGAYQLADLGRAYFYPTGDDDKRKACLGMLCKPPVFKHLIETFDGDKIPSPSILGNILHQRFSIPDSWKDRVASLFVRNAQFLGIIDANGMLRYDAGMHDRAKQEPATSVEDDPIDPSTKQQTPQTPPPPQPLPTSAGRAVWHFPYKGSFVRLDTPEDCATELWEKLNAYVQVIKPTAEKPIVQMILKILNPEGGLGTSVEQLSDKLGISELMTKQILMDNPQKLVVGPDNLWRKRAT